VNLLAWSIMAIIPVLILMEHCVPFRVKIMNDNIVAALIIAILVVGLSTVLINNTIKKIDRCNSAGMTYHYKNTCADSSGVLHVVPK
jgi:hypothetical protein